jgi:L-fuconolactonase
MDPAEWLAQVKEEILDPALPICDPHHHLWDYPGRRYLLDELLADTGSGHRVVATVFVECASMYRADGPAALRPVGETDFVNGIASMSDSGRFGPTRVAAGIVGFADLALGERVAEVLDAHLAASSRFRGIRHAAGWDASEAVRNSHTNPPAGTSRRRALPARLRGARPAPAHLRRLAVPPAASGADGARPGLSRHHDRPRPLRRAARHRPLCRPSRGDLHRLAGSDPRPRRLPERGAKLGGLAMPINGFGFHRRERPATSAELVEATGDWYRHAIDCFGVERCMWTGRRGPRASFTAMALIGRLPSERWRAGNPTSP